MQEIKKQLQTLAKMQELKAEIHTNICSVLIAIVEKIKYNPLITLIKDTIDERRQRLSNRHIYRERFVPGS